MQQATVQLGKIAIQAIVNTMGVNAMAAFAAAGRIDDFAYVPQQNIGHATTTLMAQNRGAGKKERVRASFFCGLKLEFLYAILSQPSASSALSPSSGSSSPMPPWCIWGCAFEAGLPVLSDALADQWHPGRLPRPGRP